MPRPKVNINPKCGKNLKKLCDDENISQAGLAEMIFVSQQTISKIINGKATLTEQTARAITEKFPKYRMEWLLGYDSFETIDDYLSSILSGQTEIQSIIERLMVLHGYRVIEEQVAPNIHLMTDEDRHEYKRRPYYETRHALKDSNGNIKYLDTEELIEIFKMIDDFVEFICSRTVERPFADYLHTRKEAD